MTEPAIRARGLRKSYGALEAVRGLDLDVAEGEIFAFLGPNGAGKTTTVEVLEGYRSRSAGEVEVLGRDPAHPTRAWRERLGIVLQSSNMPAELTVAETVAQYAGYYRSPRSVADTIERVGLGEQCSTRVGRLSGGQQRRLDVALALVGDPELVFLDEPTTGFDPSARRSAWGLISELRELGKTVFLTTHYMDEAQALADRIMIIAGGSVVAQGTPSDIGGRASAASVVRFRVPERAPGLTRAVGRTGRAPDGRRELRTEDPVRTLHALTSWALDRRVDVAELTVAQPTLEDVYLALTEET